MEMILRDIRMSFGDLQVLGGIDISVEENRLVCILGPSGCGKTTLLNIIAGTITPDRGEMSGFAGRTLSYLFQEPRLLPWKTVRENLDFVLKGSVPGPERWKIIDRYLEMMRLTQFGDYYPKNLSGGMKQRVALARAFAYPSDMLLMDEPFASLDIEMRQGLMEAFMNLWLKDRRTVFFVTHDPEEALLLGDDIIVLTARPAVVKARMVNETPFPERRAGSERMQELRRQVYAALGGREPVW